MKQFILFHFSTNAKKESPILAFWRLMYMKTKSREAKNMMQLLLLYFISLKTLMKDLGCYIIDHYGVQEMQNNQPTLTHSNQPT